ncbi:hypothetical protein B0H10DRAFT_1980512 [Mycena sp. CBHHK59/15]|nr:hypothetical protein B0H10DRAFT_1980512 [Mycena sp. CBHHK59/15]
MANESPARSRSLWKGKQKATDPIPADFDDPHPTITYRTLFAQNLGVRDPLRAIALCDSDAFYAACEMVRLGVPDKPLVVLQWQSIIAVNYPARKFGITRMMKIQDAKERCPKLVVVHVATFKEGEKEPGYWENPDSRTHKVSLDFYRRESLKILELYKEGLPENTEIEKASIDEAFMDFTRPVRQILLDRYPHLAHVPDDAPLGLDTPLPPPPQISWRQDNIPSTWHDVALSIAAELMAKVREEISSKLGYTTSAGIAKNKFLAKSILRNAAIPNYLKPMAFQKVCKYRLVSPSNRTYVDKIRFLGGKLGGALANEMQNKFGEESIWIYEVLRWLLQVKEKQALNKSMLASKNLPQPITKASEGYHWIRVLAAELALRLNDARKVTPNMWPKTIVLHARKAYEAQRSKQAPFPFVRDVTVDVVAAAGDKLWKELVGVDSSIPMKVTNVSLAFSGIEGVESGLQNIGSFLTTGLTSKRPLEEDPEDEKERVRAAKPPSRNIAKDLSSFVCSRCGQRSSLPRSAIRTDAERQEALALMQMEHEDFHLALDLSKVASNVSPVRESGKTKTEQPKKKKRRKETPKGIEKFFTKS